jgi:hypothetical protein
MTIVDSETPANLKMKINRLKADRSPAAEPARAKNEIASFCHR